MSRGTADECDARLPHQTSARRLELRGALIFTVMALAVFRLAGLAYEMLFRTENHLLFDRVPVSYLLDTGDFVTFALPLWKLSRELWGSTQRAGTVNRGRNWYLRTGLIYLAAPFVGALVAIFVSASAVFPKAAAVAVFVVVGLSGAAFAARQRSDAPGKPQTSDEHLSGHRLP